MSRRDDVKLLFNFMIELLKEEETKPEVKTEVKTEVKQETKELLTEKQEESAKHILDVMKRAELMDKMRRTTMSRPTLVPTNQRDIEDVVQNDKKIIETHEAESKTKSLNELKTVLTNAKNFMDDLETKKPLTPSVPPSVLNEQENHIYEPISKSDKKVKNEY